MNDESFVAARADLVNDIQFIITAAGVAEKHAVAKILIENVRYSKSNHFTIPQYRPCVSDPELLENYREQVAFHNLIALSYIICRFSSDIRGNAPRLQEGRQEVHSLRPLVTSKQKWLVDIRD